MWTGWCVRGVCWTCALPASDAWLPPKMRRATAMGWGFHCHRGCPQREPAERFALDTTVVEEALLQLAHEGRVLEGGFRPGGLHREWCDAEILRQIRRKSLAKLRREVEPVEQQTLARFLTHWQGLLTPRRGATLDALLDAVESLQGAPLPA
jgi:ATP-dependent Lhr-like helicase